MEELVSIPKYAAQNRLSIHTVIKKTMNGELKTVVQKEGEKEVKKRKDRDENEKPDKKPTKKKKSDKYPILLDIRDM